MTKRVLLDYQRVKEDDSEDSIFYSSPRFVHHLDNGFRNRLTTLYKNIIEPNSIVLDLMSSWVSHLPPDLKLTNVIGHGLNETELKSNSQLNSYWIQDLNKNQILPLEDSSIDFCTIVAGWQYLQEPEAISSELLRVIKSEGKLIISFSDRAFWHKSPHVWVNATGEMRLNYISAILVSQGWPSPEKIKETPSTKPFLKLFNKQNDPFYAVIAINRNKIV